MPRIPYEQSINPNLTARSATYRDNSVDYSPIAEALNKVAEHEKFASYATDMTNANLELAKMNEDIRNSGQFNRSTGKWSVGGQEIEDKNLFEYQSRRTKETLSPLQTRYSDNEKAQSDIMSLGLNYDKHAVMNNSAAKTQADIDYIGQTQVTFTQAVSNKSIDVGVALTNMDGLIESSYATPEQKALLKRQSNDDIGSADFFTKFNQNPADTYELLKNTETYNYTSDSARNRMDTHAKNWAASEARNAISMSQNSSALLFRYQIDPQVIRLAKDTGNVELAAAAVASNKRNADIQAMTNANLPQSAATLDIAMKEALSRNDANAVREIQDMQRAVASVAQTAKTNPEIVALQHGLTEQPVPLEMSAQGVEGFWASMGRLREEIKTRYGIEPDAVSDTGANTIVNAVMSNNVDDRVGALYALTAPVTDRDIAGVSKKIATISPNAGVVLSLKDLNDQELSKAILSGNDYKKSYGLPQDQDMRAMFKKVIGDQLVEADPAMQNALYESYTSAYAYYASKGQVSNATVSEDISKDIASRMTGKRFSRFGDSAFNLGGKKTINFAIGEGQWADADTATDAMETALSTGYFEGIYGMDGIPANSKEVLKHGSMIPTGKNGVYTIKRSDGGYYADINGNPYMFDAKSAYTLHASKMPLGKFKQKDGQVSSR